MFLNLFAAITIIPALLSFLLALNSFSFCWKWSDMTTEGVVKPTIHGCCMILSQSRRAFGSTTSSYLIKFLAESEMSSQYGDGKSNSPF